MNSPRLQKLMDFLKEEPNNPFLIYGVALELEKTDLSKAIEFYQQLLRDHPDYLPTYFQAAHLFWEEEETDMANDIFIRGIKLAEAQGNDKILKELKAAYHNFSMEYGY